jgi:ADP-ribose pyrophosphatase YjhB (NUDIX family)
MSQGRSGNLGTVARQAEYFHDPRAPRANSLRPTVFAAVRDGDGRLLLVRRSDTLNWELPGGKVDIGESAADTVVREVTEESGVQIFVRGLAGIYTDPGHVMVYVDGEVRQQFSVCFHAVPLSGAPRPDGDETIDAAWFRTDELGQLPVHPSMRLRIDHAVHHPDQVHIH